MFCYDLHFPRVAYLQESLKPAYIHITSTNAHVLASLLTFHLLDGRRGRAKEVENLHNGRADNDKEEKGNESLADGILALLLASFGALALVDVAAFGHVAVELGVAVANVAW